MKDSGEELMLRSLEKHKREHQEEINVLKSEVARIDGLSVAQDKAIEALTRENDELRNVVEWVDKMLARTVENPAKDQTARIYELLEYDSSTDRLTLSLEGEWARRLEAILLGRCHDQHDRSRLGAWLGMVLFEAALIKVDDEEREQRSRPVMDEMTDPATADCPHAQPYPYCNECKVSPCPIGRDGGAEALRRESRS